MADLRTSVSIQFQEPKGSSTEEASGPTIKVESDSTLKSPDDNSFYLRVYPRFCTTRVISGNCSHAGADSEEVVEFVIFSEASSVSLKYEPSSQVNISSYDLLKYEDVLPSSPSSPPLGLTSSPSVSKSVSYNEIIVDNDKGTLSILGGVKAFGYVEVKYSASYDRFLGKYPACSPPPSSSSKDKSKLAYPPFFCIFSNAQSTKRVSHSCSRSSCPPSPTHGQLAPEEITSKSLEIKIEEDKDHPLTQEQSLDQSGSLICRGKFYIFSVQSPTIFLTGSSVSFWVSDKPRVGYYEVEEAIFFSGSATASLTYTPSSGVEVTDVVDAYYVSSREISTPSIIGPGTVCLAEEKEDKNTSSYEPSPPEYYTVAENEIASVKDGALSSIYGVLVVKYTVYNELYDYYINLDLSADWYLPSFIIASKNEGNFKRFGSFQIPFPQRAGKQFKPTT